MRTKNSSQIDTDEAAWLADVKSVPCVFCNAKPPSEAHHPIQGLHLLTVAACDPCHDSRVWNLGGMTELEAVNETIRRVVRFRAGKPIIGKPALPRSRGTGLSSSKILPRVAA